MLKFIGIIFCGALLFLAGCAAPPSEEPVPKEWSVTSPAHPAAGATNMTGVSVNQPPGLSIPVKEPIKTAPTNHVNIPTNIVRPMPAPITTWTSLGQWAKSFSEKDVAVVLAVPHKLFAGAEATSIEHKNRAFEAFEQ